MKTIRVKTKNMTTFSSNGEIFHTVLFNVIIDGKMCVLKNDYDIELYLIEAEWVGEQYEAMSAEDFTEKYTLDMITGMKEKTLEVE